MSRIEGRLAKTLLSKPTVVTRAVFWRIPHNSGIEDICLKIGRYKKSAYFSVGEDLETLQPKSELTLVQEEFRALIEFLQESYEPFRQGVKAFIPLEQPFHNENAKQIRALFSLPNKLGLIQFILDNDVIPEELMSGLNQARRVRAVLELQDMLNKNLKESPWQKWFQENSWVLGSQFVRVLEERQIDTQHISDFLMETYDGFLDVVEIKRPEGGMNFWSQTLDHGNHVPSVELTKAITQASRYIYEIEREANSVKFQQRLGGVRTVKPRCVLVFGRSNVWDDEQTEAYRILNSSFHNLTILTYDHVLERARSICGL
ncbi:Shedu anti-phage system protein SduA domain-containing protein [Methylophilus sp.]|uniref:Shedu anti-phage system protein SduA domain-containing protein n=1 Tax=Methylophilus sp. TaxID=29541 RepID=UPI000D4AFC50|nr:Shedu anti-phage system protein SduA domain-containing protein [Methylophilus sp.]PPD11483.1 MAG: hypothetical protein CTY26_08880 [Methylophilus sp.]